jgi:valyl-tRNA synthetase
MIARSARMLGYRVLFPLGIDRNGLPCEVYTERKYGIKMHEVPRKKFIFLCKHALDELEEDMIEIMKRSGIGYTYGVYYRTDSPNYRKFTQATFIDLWKKGLIYESRRPNNYCPICKTTIADAEIEYEKTPATLAYIKFKLKEGGEIEIATTRPELLCSCAAILYNPEDERYKKLEGKHAIVPIFSQEVPIIPHPFAKPEFGTGLVMVCSYGDYSDVRLFRELGFQAIKAIDEDGKLTKAAGRWEGMLVKDARDSILRDLEKLGLLAKKEKVMHRTPVCGRSKDPIEIIEMKEYYLKQLEFIDKLRLLIPKMKFHPIEHRQILINWINSITLDWPISRRRYYGTEIPLWYCKDCGKACLPPKGRYYQPWREKPPFKLCPHCNSRKGFRGEIRTFDTWFDSSISCLYVRKYLRKSKEKKFICSLRPQGKDIVRTWLYYTLLRIYQLKGKLAFQHVWISGMGVDEGGERMSKSKGNIVYPRPILKKYGGDAFRLWGASEASLGSDFRFSEEKVSGAFKFLTKLWNVARFISNFEEVKRRPKLKASDEWIIGELNNLIKRCISGYKEFNFFIPAIEIKSFLWGMFAPHYIEMVKERAYLRDKSATYTLHLCLKTLLKLLAPICPFITDKLWRSLYSKRSIHLERFPRKRKDWESKLTRLTQSLLEFNSGVWKYKKSKGIALSAELGSYPLPNELRPFAKDLKRMHRIVSFRKD